MADDRSFHETLTAAVTGDPRAFDSLFARNMPALQAFVRLRTGPVVKERESISDLVQSVCREVLKDMDGFEYQGDEGFRKWLFMQATRKIIDRHRFWAMEKRDIAREVAQEGPRGDDDSAEQLLDCYATLCTPSRAVAARDEVSRIEAALAELPEDQRDALAMSRMMGLGYPEIAATMGRTESAVRGLVARGLARLAMMFPE